MGRAAGLFVATLAAVALTWWWLGRPVEAPAAAADPGRIQCLSYAPFRGNESPLDADTRVEGYEIEEDLAKLARLTDCIRTYSTENGLDQVPAIAQRVGLKVIQGLWLGSDRKKNRIRIDETIALAKRYREVITAIVVGNEVLLRGELSAVDIGDILREVKAATAMPVTYADVWEYWLRNPELAQAVDFVTVHILPYWEDFPISAAQAGAHVDAIRSRVAARFPGKDILIGEVGWPSAGRMREGALPSPANQALVLEEVMARARARNYRVNLIEAFDQPWKRRLEGTVGGYWGLLTSGAREPKFAWGKPVSDHPLWGWQMAAGMALAAAVFAAACAGRSKIMGDLGTPVLAGIIVDALAGGIAAPWAVANAATESLGVGGWARGLAFVAVSVAAPVAAAMMLSRGMAVPPFGRTLARAAERPRTGACGGERRDPGRRHRAGAADRAGARVRPALPRPHLCADDGGRHPVCRRFVRRRKGKVAARSVAARPRRAHRRRHPGGVGGLHRSQRELRELAGAVVRRHAGRPRRHTVSVTGRAKHMISSAAAKPDRLAL